MFHDMLRVVGTSRGGGGAFPPRARGLWCRRRPQLVAHVGEVSWQELVLGHVLGVAVALAVGVGDGQRVHAWLDDDECACLVERGAAVVHVILERHLEAAHRELHLLAGGGVVLVAQVERVLAEGVGSAEVVRSAGLHGDAGEHHRPSVVVLLLWHDVQVARQVVELEGVDSRAVVRGSRLAAVAVGAYVAGVVGQRLCLLRPDGDAVGRAVAAVARVEHVVVLVLEHAVEVEVLGRL